MMGNAYQAEMGYGRLPPLCVICGMRARTVVSKEEMNVEACTFPPWLYFKILESTSEKKTQLLVLVQRRNINTTTTIELLSMILR